MAEIMIPELVTGSRAARTLVQALAGEKSATRADQLPCGICGLPVHKDRGLVLTTGPVCRIDRGGRVSCTVLFQGRAKPKFERELKLRLSHRDEVWAEVEAIWAEKPVA